MSTEYEGEDHDFSTVDLLEMAREEGQRTIREQISTFDDIDDKAARTLRLNLLVLSILLTGFSIIATEGGFANGDVARSLQNLYVFAGVFSILVSTILAAFIYTGSNYRSGMSGRDIEALLEPEPQPIDRLYDMVEGYAEWAQHNYRVNTRTAPLSTAMLLTLIYGLIFLTTGVYHAVIQEIGPGSTGLILGVLSYITWRSGFHRQARRHYRYRDFEPGED